MTQMTQMIDKIRVVSIASFVFYHKIYFLSAFKRSAIAFRNTSSFYDEYDYPCIDTTDMTIMEAVERVCEVTKLKLQ